MTGWILMLAASAIGGSEESEYDVLRRAAIVLNKPLVVGVGCEPPRGPWLRCRVPAPFHWQVTPGIMVSRPSNGDLDLLDTLVFFASAGDVRAVLAKSVSVAAPLVPAHHVAPAAGRRVSGGSC